MNKSLSIVALLFALCACVPNTQIEPSFRGNSTTATGAFQPPPSFAHFKEFPIPEQATMDLKRTLLFGSEPIIGRLVFYAPYSQKSVFDFYMLEMAKFGWQEITMIRSQNSVLTFEKENRIATIQLSSTAVNGTDVVLDISLAKGRKP